MSTLPLSGRTVLVTRTREQAGGLVDQLHALGATVVVVPLISTVPLATPDEVRAAAVRLRDAPEPRWVAFTSAVAVRLVFGALAQADLASASLAAVGAETARAVEARGASVSLVPAQPDSAGLARELAPLVAGGTVW
ncbi:MAG TPA: uroporphyrinogen-III synthase, partial [Candidatus Dormibacteraeota bacterium]|nr:uroporphyrinogen-III synthase [Candidatus Dormibacteraeota bacterium]